MSVSDNKTNAGKGLGTLVIGVLSLQLIQQISFAMAPAFADFAKYWPDIPYSRILMLQTFGYLCIIPTSILGGAIAGSKIKYKTLSLISIILVLVGVVPFFYHENFYFVLATRAIVGCGIGLTFGTAAAVITFLFSGKMRGRMQGVATIVLTCSGVVYSFVGGLLCAKNVHFVWLIHLFMIIPLVLVILFLREPTKEELAAAEAETASTEVSTKPDYNWRATLIPFVFGAFMMLPYAVVLNMSAIVDYRGLGSAAVSGTVGAFYTVGGLVAGVAVGPIYMKFKKYSVIVAVALMVLGMACAGWGGNVPMLCISEFLVGLGTFVLHPVCVRDCNAIVSPKGLMFCGGLFGGTWNAGAFITGFLITLANSIGGDAPYIPIQYFTFAAIIAGVVWQIFRAMRPKAQEEAGLY